MAEHGEETKHTEGLMEKISEKIHSHDSSSSSSSDSDNEKEVKHHSVPTSSSPKGVQSAINRLFGRKKPVHHVFGGGKPADVFLWRNKKISASVLGGATVAWVLFELLEFHLLTLVCHCAILTLAVMFLCFPTDSFFLDLFLMNLLLFFSGLALKIPEVHLPEDPFLQIAAGLRIEINRALACLREIASGHDLKKFLAVIAGLWVLSIVGAWCNFLTLFYIGKSSCITCSCCYTVPCSMKYEDQVDTFAEKAMHELKKQYVVFVKRF
ncbi:hypothetical protein MKW92_024417 [Papaver armeniacum]|nr:hypothetical protein MKW92_024417 [Papaver armeniacum]